MQAVFIDPCEAVASEEESVAIRNEDWNAIHKAINESTETAVRTLRPSGWRKALHILREWGVLGTIATVIVALVAIAAAAWYQAFARIEKETTFQVKTESRLLKIEEILHIIQADLSKQSLINHAALPLPDFKATLPDLRSAVATARQQRVKISPATVADLQQKLIASKDPAPTYWSTVSDFISYRSQISLEDFQSLLRPDLPNCTDHDPKPIELIVGEEDEKAWKLNEARPLEELSRGKKNGTKLVSALYEDCRFTLDSPEETARIPNLGEQRSYILTFRHCQIVYRGGRVALLTPHPHPALITGKSSKRSDVYIVVGQTVRFDNCLFVFVINSQPPREGQWLTEQLLEQSGPRVIVTTPKPATPS